METKYWFVLPIVLGIGIVAECTANARDRQETALLLARTCVAEISFVSDVRECELMWEINARNARKRGRSLYRQTRMFNSFWKSRAQRNRRPWIAHLKNGKQPDEWPRHLSWAKYRPMWERYLRAAQRFLTQQTNHCPDAVDYGARGEVPRMYLSGQLQKIECLGGKTRQVYWGIL